MSSGELAASAPPAQPVRKVPEPLEGMELTIAGIVLAVVNFLVVLDATIANVSLPTITGALAASPSEGTWIITSYQVAEAITVPLTGWLARRFGTLRTLCVCMVAFATLSLCCGLARSLPVLVTLRVVQGFCGGPMIPLSQTLLLLIYPKEKMNSALGLWVTTTVAAPIFGPLIGGLLSEYAGWPWIFFIAVPIVAVCVATAWYLLKDFETSTIRNPIDYVGLVLLFIWVGALQMMLDKGSAVDWFESRLIVILAIVALIGFLAFLIWELTDEHPVVDLRVLRHRAFALSTAGMGIAYGAIFASSVLMSLWLQTNLLYTSAWAGYAMAFSGVFAVLMSPFISNVLMPRVDTRLLVFAGGMGYVALSFWRATLSTDYDFESLIPIQLFQGVLSSLFFMPITMLGLFSLAPHEMAAGTSLQSFSRIVSASFGTSIMTTAWTDLGAVHRADLIPHITPYNPQTVAALDVLAKAGMTHGQAVTAIDSMLDRQAVLLATDHVFWYCGVIFFAVTMLTWLLPKTKNPAGGGAGGH
jgi:DHA2 family multidrug resistance protein